MTQHIGRFAPTPSGPLHFGSLVAALGSYLIAKSQGGKWLVRVEDLDPPREQAGATKSIIKTLEAFGFEWDGDIVYQSQRSQYYLNAISQLKDQSVSYYCCCSRKQVEQRNSGVYDGYCRDKNLGESDAALKVKFGSGFSHFYDHIQGDCVFDSPNDIQDFVIQRRDKLFAYQLAVVVDDIEQQINHVVRGADILDSTPRQNFLYHCFNKSSPDYYHLPLVVDEQGRKLSKSQLDPAIKTDKASQLLVQALKHLGQKTPDDLEYGKPSEILAFAIGAWDTYLISQNPQQIKPL